MYRECSSYTKELTYVKEFGSSHVMYVIFKDSDGVLLTWTTTHRTKGYKNLVKHGRYFFKVTYIFEAQCDKVETINIARIRLEEELKDGYTSMGKTMACATD